MQPVALTDVLPLAEYESMREAMRRRIIELKKRRRVAVGPAVSFVFENRDTVLFQIQEMVRAERITDPEKIAEEVDTYNAILPGPGELAATLFIEITDPTRVQEDLERFRGIEQGAVFLEIGDDQTTPAVFEDGAVHETKISAVRYVRFPLTHEARHRVRNGADPLALVIDHPHYQARATVHEAVRDSLREDLAG